MYVRRVTSIEKKVNSRSRSNFREIFNIFWLHLTRSQNWNNLPSDSYNFIFNTNDHLVHFEIVLMNLFEDTSEQHLWLFPITSTFALHGHPSRHVCSISLLFFSPHCFSNQFSDCDKNTFLRTDPSCNSHQTLVDSEIQVDSKNPTVQNTIGKQTVCVVKSRIVKTRTSSSCDLASKICKLRHRE